MTNATWYQLTDETWLLAKFLPNHNLGSDKNSRIVIEQMGFIIVGETEHCFEVKPPTGWTWNSAPTGDWLLICDADGNPRINQYQSTHIPYMMLRNDY